MSEHVMRKVVVARIPIVTRYSGEYLQYSLEVV